MLELEPKPSVKTGRPDLKAETVQGGFLLKPAAGCSLPAGLFMTAVAAAILGGVLYGWAGPVAAALGAGLIVVIAGSILVWQYLIHRGLHPAELAIDRWPVPPGEPVAVRFRQRLKKQLYVRELTATVRCVETARYRVGTDTKTATHTSHDETLPPVAVDTAAEDLAADWSFTVPADAAYSFEAADNTVKWELRVTVVIDGYPDACPCFPLLVAPPSPEGRR